MQIAPLNSTYTIPLKVLCETLCEEIKFYFPHIRTLIIQYNDGIIRVGHGGNGFLPDYFDPTRPYTISDNITGYIVSNENLITSLYEKILHDNPKMRLKCFNIHYDGKTSKVSICKNRIRSICLEKCLLYEPF